MFDWYEEKVKQNPFYKRQPIVVHKGSYRPKILWIGEAPCRKAALTKEPFSGISGKILDKWINFVGGYKYSAVINVCPLVLTENNFEKLISPSKEIMDAFAPLCLDLIEFLHPEETIGLGVSVKKALETEGILYLKHPAWYARNGKYNEIPEELKAVNKKLFSDKISAWW